MTQNRFLLSLASLIGFSVLAPQVHATDLQQLEKVVSLQQALLNQLIPTGTVISYAGNIAPNGSWLLAEGQLLSKSAYPKLAAVLGQTYCSAEHGGACDPDSFRLPDLRGRAVAGLEAQPNRLKTVMNSNVLGATSGAAITSASINVTKQPEFTNPAYTHAAFTKIVTNGELNYTIGGYYAYGDIVRNRSAAPGIDFAVSLGHSHAYEFTLPERGARRTQDVEASTNAINNMQPTVVLRYLIKAT